jgi:hypothetical protein
MPRIPRGDVAEGIYHSVNRQAPLGEEGWQMEVASQYGLLSTLGSRGRPRKDKNA